MIVQTFFKRFSHTLHLYGFAPVFINPCLIKGAGGLTRVILIFLSTVCILVWFFKLSLNVKASHTRRLLLWYDFAPACIKHSFVWMTPHTLPNWIVSRLYVSVRRVALSCECRPTHVTSKWLYSVPVHTSSASESRTTHVKSRLRYVSRELFWISTLTTHMYWFCLTDVMRGPWTT